MSSAEAGTIPGTEPGQGTPPTPSLWARIDRGDLTRLGAVAVLGVLAALSSGLGAWWWTTPLLAGAGLVVGCWPIVVEAWQDVRARRMSMELSMLIAIAAAALIGEWVTAVTITVFVLAAEILEDLCVDRGRDALSELLAFLPSSVHVRRGNEVCDTPLDEVVEGDVLSVLPGERIPVDGTVIDGASSVDQSRITGEPLPVDVSDGSSVFAGSVNQLGAIGVVAERVGETSSYGQIVAAVRAAQGSQAPVQRLADRIAGLLVYVALAAAAVTYLITRDLRATISVVIVAGACGVAAGTPLAILAAIARTARAGAFVKDGTHLELLSGIDTVVFDKTGTLTRGQPVVTGVVPAEGFDVTEVLQAAAGAEMLSEHPLGAAILAHARDEGLTPHTPSDFGYQPGRGLTATVDGRCVRVGNAELVPEASAWTPPADVQGVTSPGTSLPGTWVHVAIGDAYAGTIVLADAVRESARRCIDELRGMGLRTVMMTGDAEAAARAVGRTLGMDEVHAELLPADKSRLIEAQVAAGRRVAMVGDGVNDAPALALAGVGIAMGSGTHIARESADIVLISSDLDDLTSTIRTSRRARRIIMANVAGTIAVDLLGMVLAGFGVLGPLAASIVHVGSESAFILNSARLIPGRRGR
ncbi:hypothetical protein GCM10009785_06890 [Brooklawnia cerclae]|uniref:Heavy metal translocating P-type ATPase n=1 Tax=Brooklawnia cerclae TaxID=349934 RepID=A0ABX0SDA9_9ACTN|nr:heavy metal translocating P-type ATPase [Brooklawnia cerclae]